LRGPCPVKMRLTSSLAGSLLLACQLTIALSAAVQSRDFIPDKIEPKFFIISLVCYYPFLEEQAIFREKRTRLTRWMCCAVWPRS
jgi:hypothetical protein